jgi:hypothetical protein
VRAVTKPRLYSQGIAKPHSRLSRMRRAGQALAGWPKTRELRMPPRRAVCRARWRVLVSRPLRWSGINDGASVSRQAEDAGGVAGCRGQRSGGALPCRAVCLPAGSVRRERLMTSLCEIPSTCAVACCLRGAPIIRPTSEAGLRWAAHGAKESAPDSIPDHVAQEHDRSPTRLGARWRRLGGVHSRGELGVVRADLCLARLPMRGRGWQ